MENADNDGKLRPEGGKIQTPFKHVTLIAEGIAGELQDGFICPPGKAFIGMKAWARSDEEAADMIQVIGKQISFEITGDIQIYYTDPSIPPQENPHGYDIKFTPFEE